MTDLTVQTTPTFRPLDWIARVFRRAEGGRRLEAAGHETCARRDFVTRLIAEDPSCVACEHGVAGMMTLFPRDF